MDLFKSFEEWKERARLIQTPEQFYGYLCPKLESLPVGTKVGFDVETTQFQSRKRYQDIDLLGVGLAFDDYTCYIPLNHILNGPQLSGDEVIKHLNEYLFTRGDLIKIAHNLKFDMGMLQKEGAKFERPYACTQIMSWLVDESSEHGLKPLANEILGMRLVSHKTINNGRLIDADIIEVARYCRLDARATLRLFDYFHQILRDEDLIELFKWEMRVVPVVTDMETVGMNIDEEELAKLAKSVSNEVIKLKKDIFKCVGFDFNTDSTLHLRKILFKNFKLEPTRFTKSGEPSTDERSLEELQGQHEVVDLLLKYRKYRKLQSTYTEGFKKILINGVVYGEFNQMGTDTGRFSSAKPNLQNLPRDSKEYAEFRRIFTAPDGFTLIDVDYSQLELRLLAHFSKDPGLLKGFNDGVDGHTATASIMFGVPYDKVTKEQRQIAKNINFALSYGAGIKKLAQMLDSSIEFAREMWELHHSKYKVLNRWRESMVKECRVIGYVTTLLNRRRRLPEINDPNPEVSGHAERQAVNAIIQGSAADVVKAAMALLWEQYRKDGLIILSQVHDEIIMICEDEKVDDFKPLIKETMEHPLGYELDVPLIVDPGVGRNWSEAKS